jgi:hypothetical protein
MQRFLSPLCLFLCLALLVTAFALLATDAPEPNVQLHRATAMGDEAYRQVLEKDLARRIWMRRALIGTLFVAALALGIGAFLSVAGSQR